MGYPVPSLARWQAARPSRGVRSPQEQRVCNLLSPHNGESDPAAIPSNSTFPGIPPQPARGLGSSWLRLGEGCPSQSECLFYHPFAGR